MIEDGWCAEFGQYFCFKTFFYFPGFGQYFFFSVGRQPYYQCWKHSPPSMQVIILIAIIITIIVIIAIIIAIITTITTIINIAIMGMGMGFIVHLKLTRQNGVRR